MDTHKETVLCIAERVRRFHDRGEPFRLYHGSTNSTRYSCRHVDNVVDTSELKNIFKVDRSKKTVLVEPNVSMEALIDATLPHGLVPLVVMEFPAITIILADGTVSNASKYDKQDLFWGAASGFGTLGVVTLLEVQLKDAKTFVKLTYKVAWGFPEAAETIKKECEKDENDYIDGIVYSKDAAVICIGRLMDRIPSAAIPRQLSRRKDEWFYLHVEKVLDDLRKGSAVCIIDYIPLRDYLFRYDRGGFWVAKYAFQYFITPFNRVTRYILDPLLRAQVMYSAGHKSKVFDYYMVQDVGVPYSHALEFQNWLDNRFGIYPLWVCPLRVQRDEPDSNHGLHADFGKPGVVDYLNFGIWGPLKGNRRDAIEHNRALERKVGVYGGKKWLYAQAYYTEDEFWSQYDKESCDELRKKYGASSVPSVYEKVKVDIEGDEGVMRSTANTRWPWRGLYGVCKAVFGGDYLLH